MKKVKVSREKYQHIKKLSDENNIITALAIDQRGSLKKMLKGKFEETHLEDKIREFKRLISKSLTPFASSILLDPEYGLPASQERADNSGLLLAYEKTGYDSTQSGRLPSLLEEWSVYRLKESGADAVKFLLYYDTDEAESINDLKRVIIERVGTECTALDLPFFLEIITYDSKLNDSKSSAYAKLKPRKVIEAMKEFSKDKYQVDVLKVEVPVNMKFVEGFKSEEVDYVYSQEEAINFFKAQSQATHIPFIFLSAGVSIDLFKETLHFAKKAGSTFNGVLCGRATWKDSVDIYADRGEEAAWDWLNSEGKDNILSLNSVVVETATPSTDYFEVINQ